VIVTLLPATVIEPLRLEEVVFAATVKAVAPLPLPLAPDVTMIQELSLEDVHEQLDGVVIDTDPLPPLASKANEPGVTVYVHGVTVTVAAALSIVPQPFVTRTQ